MLVEGFNGSSGGGGNPDTAISISRAVPTATTASMTTGGNASNVNTLTNAGMWYANSTDWQSLNFDLGSEMKVVGVDMVLGSSAASVTNVFDAKVVTADSSFNDGIELAKIENATTTEAWNVSTQGLVFKNIEATTRYLKCSFKKISGAAAYGVLVIYVIIWVER